MIISASRRTDIPFFYSKWFINRIREGHVLIPNPYNSNRISSVKLSPKVVDCIVFWTKNPRPMMKYLNELDSLGYNYYFQFTLTPYGSDIELNLPSKAMLIETFIELSKMISSKKLIWRYDPIFIDEVHSIQWHIDAFNKMCKSLSGYTNKCIISFIDIYRSIKNRYRPMTEAEIKKIASEFSRIANENKMVLSTCCETYDLSEYGIKHGACVDKDLIEEILECTLDIKIDVNQREHCKCVESIDIGVYDTCLAACDYCYACNSSKPHKTFNDNSPMLTGKPKGHEIISEKNIKSNISNQLKMF